MLIPAVIAGWLAKCLLLGGEFIVSCIRVILLLSIANCDADW